jgi:hypothetical protein
VNLLCFDHYAHYFHLSAVSDEVIFVATFKDSSIVTRVASVAVISRVLFPSHDALRALVGV